jgi:hypothetical protein
VARNASSQPRLRKPSSAGRHAGVGAKRRWKVYAIATALSSPSRTGARRTGQIASSVTRASRTGLGQPRLLGGKTIMSATLTAPQGPATQIGQK